MLMIANQTLNQSTSPCTQQLTAQFVLLFVFFFILDIPLPQLNLAYLSLITTMYRFLHNKNPL